jgi:hypothetical protein
LYRIYSMSCQPPLEYSKVDILLHKYVNRIMITYLWRQIQLIIPSRRFRSIECLNKKKTKNLAVEHNINSWIPIEQEVWNRLYHIIRGKSDHMTYFQNKSKWRHSMDLKRRSFFQPLTTELGQKNCLVWITPGAAPIRWMGPIRNSRWGQKRTEGYVIVSMARRANTCINISNANKKIWLKYLTVKIYYRLLHGIFHIGPGISLRLPYQARQRN